MAAAIQSTNDGKLAKFGLSESDVERLVEALVLEDVHARRLVRGAIRELGDAAVPVLSKAFHSSNPTLSEEAAKLLGHRAIAFAD
jgi:hypothetical protein